MSSWSTSWDPSLITIADESIPDDWKVCVLQGAIDGDKDSSGSIAGRIVAVFVVFITSLFAISFPNAARRIKWLRIPEMVYLIAKNFGTGVIITTAFIHLMDPAYTSIGSNSCVGGIGHWADYSWCPALMLAAAVGTFLVDVYCGFFAQRWYGATHSHTHDEIAAHIAQSEQPPILESDGSDYKKNMHEYASDVNSEMTTREFHSQFSGFMVLEFGIILHSVFIGLALGSTNEWVTLFIVIIFHQMFEGLGVGVRMSQIQFPQGKGWWPWALCVAYALTTPISIGIGIGVRSSYSEDGLKQMRVQGICDALSAGVLLYTGFVELVARDWIFNPQRTKSLTNLNVQLFCFLLGAGVMALLGKWA